MGQNHICDTMLRGVLVLTLTAGAAHATEHEVAEYDSVLDACYMAAVDGAARRVCVGGMSSTCMDREEGGHSTFGMTSCLAGEARVWDKYLNQEYRATRNFARLMDEDEAVYFPEYAKRVEALVAAQRAWIAFRDAECGLAYASWGSGSMRNIAGADCVMRMTAERTIDLREMREMFE